MAFDAGSIEATLTLNRNPFTAGLAAAKQQARSFARDKIEATLGIKVDQRQLLQAEALLKRLGRMTATATAKVLVDRLSFDRLLKDLRQFDRSMYATVLRVDTAKASADVIAFRTLLSSLNDETVNLSTNTRAFGGAAREGFGQGSSHFTKMATAIIAGLPIIASGFTAAAGAVGAVTSAMLIAGAGAGAFALVAVPAFKQIKAAVAGGQEEINKLPPGLREAANGLKELLGEYDKLVVSNQKIVAISLSAWFNAGTAALKTLNPLVVASANAFGDAGLKAISFFQGPWWQGFVDFLSRSIGPAVDMLTRSIFALIQIVGNLTRAFWDLGGSQIMEMITSGLEEFAKWTERIGENTTFQQFMAAAQRSLPVVGRLIGEVLEFIIKLAIGLEPLGTLIIRVLNGIFDAVNSLPPGTISALALGFGALWAAFALGAGGPVAIAVGVLAGLAVIFTNVYTHSETLRAQFNAFGDEIRSRFLPVWDMIRDAWETKIKPAWDSLVAKVQTELIPALQRFGTAFLVDVMPPLREFVDTVFNRVIPAVLRFLEVLVGLISWIVDTFGPTIVDELTSAVTVFDGAFKTIAGLLDVFTGIFTGNWQLFFDGLYTIGEGVMTMIAGMFGMSLDELMATFSGWSASLRAGWQSFWNNDIMNFFRTVWDTMKLILSAALDLMQGNVSSAADKIGQAWRKVANLFRDPINWVINTVIGPPGGLAGAWNTVMRWIGQPQLSVERPPNIPAFASGGRVRGDGTGTSDDVPALLSNGEFVVKESVASRIYPFLSALNRGQAEAMRAASADRSIDRLVQRFAAGGIAGGQAVLNTMRGRPYIWGGGSAAGTDCSGIVAYVQRGMAGENNPYRRIGTTATMPWGGWTGGLTSALTSGVNGRGGSASHMVGNLAGTNFEARQTGTPIMVGGGARGPQQFPFRYSLSSAGGQYVGGGEGGAAPAPVSWWSIISDKVLGLFKGLFGGSIPGLGGEMGQAISQIPVKLIEKATSAIQSKLENLMTIVGTAVNTTAQGLNQNPLSGMGTADRGAIIPTGPSVLFNATGKPEPLTNLDVYERMKPTGISPDDIRMILEEFSGGSGGDTYNVMLPERASVRELADTLSFKRKVVAKGRYSR